MKISILIGFILGVGNLWLYTHNKKWINLIVGFACVSFALFLLLEGK